MSGILVLHAGLDDGFMWRKVAALLRPHYTVEVPCRLQYQPSRGPAASMAQEAEAALAVAARMAGPVLVVGHSSGAVLALECLLAGSFAGGVLYEPPVIVDTTLGGAATERARLARDRGQMTSAMRVFLRDVVRVPAWQASLGALAVTVIPRLRRLAPRQIDDLLAIEALGNRLRDYAGIREPVVLLGGDRSPAHLGERLDALERTLPHATRVVLPGQGHTAQDRAPEKVAQVILEHAARVLV
ncbi:alpha/beta fold hydrolase [Nonomuraea typhae]|uniref:alpha/beta fold hydrolase n=1 Tax=Nonomuraea typhae TaxID=2603600 RepID=UPI0012F98C5D|nr:alpha/beta hydrolase [Nonomuraea typhae]